MVVVFIQTFYSASFIKNTKKIRLVCHVLNVIILWNSLATWQYQVKTTFVYHRTEHIFHDFNKVVYTPCIDENNSGKIPSCFFFGFLNTPVYIQLQSKSWRFEKISEAESKVSIRFISSLNKHTLPCDF